MEAVGEDAESKMIKLKYAILALLLAIAVWILADAHSNAMELTESEKILIAKVVYAEANNQDMRGKRFIAATVLNRVENDGFPNTVAGVIYQENQYSSPVKYNEECLEAVNLEAQYRLDTNIVWFRTKKYHKFGVPAYKYGDHYFSGLK